MSEGHGYPLVPYIIHEPLLFSLSKDGVGVIDVEQRMLSNDLVMPGYKLRLHYGIPETTSP